MFLRSYAVITLFVFNPLEILLNAAQNRCRLLISQTFLQPFRGIAIFLAHIACWTSWQNVSGDITKIIPSKFVVRRLWNEMVLLQRVRCIPAICTSVVPPTKAKMPFSDCEGSGQVQLAIAFFLIAFSQFIWIFFTPFAPAFAHSFRIFLTITLSVIVSFFGIVGIVLTPMIANLLRIFLITLFSDTTYVFRIVLRALSGIFTSIFPIVILPFSHCYTNLIGMCVSVSCCCLARLLTTSGSIPSIWITLGILFVIFPMALATPRIQLVCHFGSKLEVVSIRQIVFATFCAALKGKGDIQHDVSLSPYLMMPSASGEISHFVGLQSLADDYKYSMGGI